MCFVDKVRHQAPEHMLSRARFLYAYDTDRHPVDRHVCQLGARSCLFEPSVDGQVDNSFRGRASYKDRARHADREVDPGMRDSGEVKYVDGES